MSITSRAQRRRPITLRGSIGLHRSRPGFQDPLAALARSLLFAGGLQSRCLSVDQPLEADGEYEGHRGMNQEGASPSVMLAEM
jgi:hypothetical protein